jgi:hypothetical protein
MAPVVKVNNVQSQQKGMAMLDKSKPEHRAVKNNVPKDRYNLC